MSKLSKAVKSQKEVNDLKLEDAVENFMGGTSYKWNPIDTLKMIAASSFFGEASYYRKDVKDGRYSWEKDYSDEFSKAFMKEFDDKSTTEIFTEAIDKALDYDFEKTLDLAVQLRTEYNMRLNPQVIMVRASIHPKRQAFTKANPNKFSEVEQKVMARADEPMTQLTYYIYNNNGKKNGMPSILKNSVAKKLESLNAYQINKYKNAEIGMINAVRLTHANSEVINELMKTGNVVTKESEKTWEQLHSEGKTWREILDSIKLGHMALLRNLRNIFTEIEDIDLCKKLMQELKDGVLNGKQFPYRYYSAYKRIKNETEVHHLPLILDTLEECMDIAVGNMPKLKGKTMCLSDNSGSAWGNITSEYGTVRTAEIDNLSSVLTAMCSDEGYVGKFGDELEIIPISKRNGALNQAQKISADGGNSVGHSTEGGIWKFFRDAIKNKTVYDNIVIYSDCQCGTGGLYGTYSDISEYKSKYSTDYTHINCFKLMQEYHKKVNPKCNFYSIQTAGYDNVLVPQNSYRCSMLTGWTGKEPLYMDAINKLWDEKTTK